MEVQSEKESSKCLWKYIFWQDYAWRFKIFFSKTNLIIVFFFPCAFLKLPPAPALSYAFLAPSCCPASALAAIEKRSIWAVIPRKPSVSFPDRVLCKINGFNFDQVQLYFPFLPVVWVSYLRFSLCTLRSQGLTFVSSSKRFRVPTLLSGIYFISEKHGWPFVSEKQWRIIHSTLRIPLTAESCPRNPNSKGLVH